MSCRHPQLKTNTLKELVLLPSNVILEVLLAVVNTCSLIDGINIIKEQVSDFVIHILMNMYWVRKVGVRV